MRSLNNGFIVRHFKRDFLTESELKNEPMKYLYVIENDNVIHSETKERMVLYKSLQDMRCYVRPYEMFMSKTDLDKYPEAKQKYRFKPLSGLDIVVAAQRACPGTELIKELDKEITQWLVGKVDCVC